MFSMCRFSALRAQQDRGRTMKNRILSQPCAQASMQALALLTSFPDLMPYPEYNVIMHLCLA